MFANIKHYHNYHNNKLIINNLQFDKLQVCVFKFTSLHLYAKLPNYQNHQNYKVINYKCSFAYLQVCTC
jgi:hypothetical protein